MAFQFSPVYIDPQTSADPVILVAKDSGYTNILDSIVKANIVRVGSAYNPNPGAAYLYPTLTRLTITMNDGSEFNVELQNVADQATWSDGTQTGLNSAVTDINASL
jgi:hypothetical protein